MFSRKTKLRIRRVFRRQKRQALDIGATTEDSLDKHVFKRLMRLYDVKRFVGTWVGLLFVVSIAVILQTQALSVYYTQAVPVAGGTFREGMIGEFTNSNPLYSQTDVDSSVSRLIFSGLFTTDTKGNLVPDIAEELTVNKNETVYTVKLKENVKWHDGEMLDSSDVVFTYNSIKNIEAQSYLFSSFRGVEVTAKDQFTVVFRLSNALSGFPYSLNTGILPAHILSNLEPGNLRSNEFNNLSPVGTGLFKFEAVEVSANLENAETRVSMTKNTDYYAGEANIERFIIRTYQDEEKLVDAFEDSEVDSMVGLKKLPDSIKPEKVQEFTVPLTGQIMVFFKNSIPIFKDKAVRQALVLDINKDVIFNQLTYPPLGIDGPFLRFQTGYDKKYAQPTNKKAQAAKILDTAGWKVNPQTGIRQKGGKPLQFTLQSSSSSEFALVSEGLVQQWKDLGVDAQVVLNDEEDLQSIVAGHNYDALLYGLLVGLDPDVYPFWHSSQADIRSESRLNLSEYKSAKADAALEAGRTRSDERNRAIKYHPFLEAWRNDYPALALYQPQFLYVTNIQLKGFEYSVAQSSVDRYLTVTDWKVRNQNQTIQ